MKPHLVCNTRVTLASAKKDCVPTTQKSCVVYEFSCRCEARYVGRTTQGLADRIKQHVRTNIRKNSNTTREQPPRICKNNMSKINCELAIGQQLIANPESPKCIQATIFGLLGKQDRLFIYVFWNLFTSRINSQSCVDKRARLIGPNWPLLAPIRRILSHLTTSEYVFWLAIKPGFPKTF